MNDKTPLPIPQPIDNLAEGAIKNGWCNYMEYGIPPSFPAELYFPIQMAYYAGAAGMFSIMVDAAVNNPKGGISSELLQQLKEEIHAFAATMREMS